MGGSAGNPSPNQKLRLREFSKLPYGDPRGFLAELKKFECEVARSKTPASLRNLRTNGLKREREMRDAALFCVGMSEVEECKVLFAPVESQDYDFVATWRDSGGAPVQNFCPVQLKEVVPTHLNADSGLENILTDLKKYRGARELVVAIKLGRVFHFDPASVVIPEGLHLGGIWIFGSLTSDQSEWGIWGDFCGKSRKVTGMRFSYPSF